MADQPLRVFLSHTAELRQYPPKNSFVRAAERAVTRAGHVLADMAYFTIRDDKPAAYCRRAVRDSDIYVGLLGFRYGRPVQDDPHRSYVELEFDAAEDFRLLRLLCMLGEDPTVPLPAKFFADVEFGRRQALFRQRVRDTIPTIDFDSPTELEMRLYEALIAETQQRTRGRVQDATRVAPPTVSPVLRVENADALRRSTDLLVLKYAQASYGVDAAAIQLMG